MKKREQIIRRELLRVDGAKPEQALPKHLKMASNPFLFFRGSAQLFYADLASGLIPLPDSLKHLPLTTIMGDCHTSNFGFMTEEGSFGERVIFAPNDFDDACIGVAAWDLLRYSCSLLLCADYCQGIAAGNYPGEPEYLDKKAVRTSDALEAISDFLYSYLDTCQRAINDRELYSQALDHFDQNHILGKAFKSAKERAFGGKKFYEKSTLAKAVDLTQLPLKFRNLPDKFISLTTEQYQACHQAFAPYIDDTILDIVQRINSGTGSNHLPRYYVLSGPADREQTDYFSQCYLVEIKQRSQASALYHFPNLSPVNQLNPAHLVVQCQRVMQRYPDLVLDELEWQQQHWLVRSRHHARVGIDPEQIGLGKLARAGGFAQYAASCGHSLALAHCRGDRRGARFEQAVAQYLPSAINDLIHTALQYSEQVKQDCQLLQGMLPKVTDNQTAA